MILFGLGLNFKVATFSIQFYPFGQKSVLTEWLSLHSMLISNGTDLGEEDYTKVVDNLDSLPESINTPFQKVKGCCWKFQLSGQININRLIWRWSLHPDKNRGNSEHQDCMRLYYLFQRVVELQILVPDEEFKATEARKIFG
jgi:hypothetical protein